MKRSVLLLLIGIILMLSACGGSQTQQSGGPETVPGASSSPTATPTPDFSGTDFSGRWYVNEIIDSNGLPVGDAEKLSLGAGFILELLPNGSYFVYGADSKVLGQGTYSIALNQLTLTAQGSSTVYEIPDAETLRITEPDTSITIMKREAKEPSEDGETATDEPATSSPSDDAAAGEEEDAESGF